MERSFKRSIASLPPVVAFLGEFFAAEAIDRGRNQTIDLAVEELFTNLVKYNKGTTRDISISLNRDDAHVEVTLTDYDVEPFDITRLKEVQIDRPLAERKPGGLGIHLVRKMVDRISYSYENRISTTTFIKTLE